MLYRTSIRNGPFKQICVFIECLNTVNVFMPIMMYSEDLKQNYVKSMAMISLASGNPLDWFWMFQKTWDWPKCGFTKASRDVDQRYLLCFVLLVNIIWSKKYNIWIDQNVLEIYFIWLIKCRCLVALKGVSVVLWVYFVLKNKCIFIANLPAVLV